MVRDTLALVLIATLAVCSDSGDPPSDGDSDGDIDNDGDGVPEGEDCDDNDPARFPGAPDVCDGHDNDCDDEVDEDGATTYYRDADEDGYGDPDEPLTSCEPAAGYVLDGADCDDTDPRYHPGATEECDDRNDYNCDGSVAYEDSDHDFYPACEDCDDTDPLVHPRAVEICNYIDDDCDDEIDERVTTTHFRDNDGDGYGDPDAPSPGCRGNPLAGFSENDMDCDDDDPETSPMAYDPCDGVDNNCNGQLDESEAATYYRDADGDGFGNGTDLVLACDAPEGYVDDPFDCDDTDPHINPDAEEVCNGVDDDCNRIIDDRC